MGLKVKNVLFAEDFQMDHNIVYSPSDVIDISEVEYFRFGIEFVGKDAGSTGNLVVNMYPVIDGIKAIAPAKTLTIPATGLTTVKWGGSESIDELQGCNGVALDFKYTNGAGDYIKVKKAVVISPELNRW